MNDYQAIILVCNALNIIKARFAEALSSNINRNKKDFTPFMSAYKYKAFYAALDNLEIGASFYTDLFKDTTHLSSVLFYYYKKRKRAGKYISRKIMDKILIARIS